MVTVLKVIPANSSREAEILATLQDSMHQDPPRDLKEVNQWSERLTAALRQGGFSFGQVLMTQNDWLAMAKTGQAIFTVLPGRISGIVVNNQSRMDTDRLQSLITQSMCGQDDTSDAAEPCLFQASRFERTTQLLQDLPGVALAGAPQPQTGSGLGNMKMAFNIGERGKPFTPGIWVDNNGVDTTGKIRTTLSFMANNYLGMGEDYSLSVTGTDKSMWTGAANAGVPIFSDGLRLTGGFTRQQYTVTRDNLSIVGLSNSSTVGLTYPFTRGLDGNLWGSLVYVYSVNSLNYTGFYNVNSSINAARFSLQANNGDRAQQLRTDQWGWLLMLTAGTQRNDDAIGDGRLVGSGPLRAGNYTKLSGNIYGMLTLSDSGDFFISARVNGQVASRNLDPSEQMGVGGPYAVRAYRPDEPMMDEGAVVSAGIYQRFPIGIGNQIQIGPFVDYAGGHVNAHPWLGWDNTYPGVPNVANIRSLAGYGLELSWLTSFGATFTASVAKPFDFSDGSWILAGQKPLQYWITVSWGR
jgi:hemolysin activation/secretion protein